MLYDFCLLYLLCSAPLEPRGLILLSVVTKVCKSTLLSNSSAGEKLPLKVFLYFSFCSLSAHRQVETKPLLIGNFFNCYHLLYICSSAEQLNFPLTCYSKAATDCTLGTSILSPFRPCFCGKSYFDIRRRYSMIF